MSDSKPFICKPTPLRELLREHGQKSTGVEAVHSVSVHKGLVNQIEHLGRSYAASDTSNYNLVRPGDIVYTKSPTGDFPLGVVRQSKLNYDAIVSPLYGVFTPVTYEVGAFIDVYFSSPSLAARYLAPLVQKGAKNTINVTNDQFLEGVLPLPDGRDRLLQIVGAFQAASEQLSVAERLVVALRRQRHGMIQAVVNDALGSTA